MKYHLRKSIMTNVVVVGAQWGDEGKGRLVDWLAERADIVARYNGGHNAGHTLVVSGKTYKLALLPSGIVRGKLGVIGNGVALDPEALLAEISRMDALGIKVSPENLVISETATLVLPIHRTIDLAQEKLRRTPIGTTLRGIGPAYEDKVGRRGLRVCDLAEPSALSEKLDPLLDYHNAWFRGLGIAETAKEAVLAHLLELAPKILPFAKPAWAILDEAQRLGRRIIFEGSQAVMLDVDWGSYPFVTSSSAVPAGAAFGTGIGASKIGSVLGVSKVYATRVGGGPFPSETHDEIGSRLREKGKEFGVNTGRPRRCGWLDIVQLRQAVKVAGIDSLALTKLDVLDGLPSIKVCVGYEIDGRAVNYVPPNLSTLEKAIPIYEHFEGWSSPTKGIKDAAKLPLQAQRLISRIKDLSTVPVSVVTTGPEREDTIVYQDVFGT